MSRESRRVAYSSVNGPDRLTTPPSRSYIDIQDFPSPGKTDMPSFSYPLVGLNSPSKPVPSQRRQQETLAERRQQIPPTHLPNKWTTNPMPDQWASDQPVTGTTDPEWDSESVYSEDVRTLGHTNALETHQESACNNREMGNDTDAVFTGFHNWKQTATRVPGVGYPGAPIDPELERTRQGYQHGKLNTSSEQDSTAKASLKYELYSPLTPFFADKSFPRGKQGSKAMFGEHGWLERSGDTPEKKRGPQKKSILGGLKRIAKEMTNSSIRSQGDDKSTRTQSHMEISLDPREQSLLYCELEFHITCAIHGYITTQLNHGRLDPDKLKRIADAWSQKGRPRVIGFRFDLKTQIELISLHAKDFRFHGRRQASAVEVSGLLHTMAMNARAMCVRTFCQPDSVIAKQLVDAQAFFDLLGVPELQQAPLQQVAQFFRVIVERERDKSSKIGGLGSDTASTLV